MKKDTVKKVIGATLTAGFAMSLSGQAVASDKVSTTSLKQGYQQLAAHHGGDGKCKGHDGKCKGKDGKCKGHDGKCKGHDGKCKGKDGKCKSHSGGKCGAGKCGANH